MTGIDLPTKRFRMKEVDPLSLHLNRKNFVIYIYIYIYILFLVKQTGDLFMVCRLLTDIFKTLCFLRY